jgi:aspartyl protease family protein
MRSFVALAVVVIAVAVFVARSADKFAATRSSTAMTATPAADVAPSAPATPNSVVLSADRLGHFHADGRIDGRHIEFLVDTGASTVALTARSAAELGIHPIPRDFTSQARTANGVVRTASIQLGMVEIGGILVRDVTAIVFPDDALGDNLLGMSFLSRLRRYEAANGRLVLEQ